MQTTDFQTQKPVKPSLPGRVGEGSIPAAPAGCISKGQIFNLLYPNRSYRSACIRDFFTADRLRRCGVSADDLRRIRILPPTATAVVIADLRQLGFIQ